MAWGVVLFGKKNGFREWNGRGSFAGASIAAKGLLPIVVATCTVMWVENLSYSAIV